MLLFGYQLTLLLFWFQTLPQGTTSIIQVYLKDTNMIYLSSSNNEAYYLTRFLTINNRTHLSSYARFSQKGVPVSAVFAVSTTLCTITRAALNISTTEVIDSDKGMCMCVCTYE